VTHVKIDFGAEFDVLGPDEFHKGMNDFDRRARAIVAAELEGVKWIRQSPVVQVPALSFQFQGPAAGFAWDLKQITCTLAAAGTVAAFNGESANGRLMAAANAPFVFQVMPFTSQTGVVLAQEQVFVLATSNIVGIMLTAVQVPAEMLGKLIS
jgi:hypothetical protein